MIRLFIIFNVFLLSLYSYSTKDVYTVAFLKDWKPYYLTNSKGEPDGYAYELFKEISKKTNLKFEYKVVDSWYEIFELAKKNEIDIVPNIGIIKERKSLFYFSQPTDTSRVKLFKREKSYDILNIEDIKTKNVGVVVRNVCRKLISNEITDNKIILNDFNTAITALSSGELDVLCYLESSLNLKLKELNLKNRIVSFGEPLTEVKRGVAVTKENFDLWVVLNEALSELKEDGTFQEIYLRWFSDKKENSISEETYLKIMTALFLTFVALITSIFWNNKLKNQYEKQKKLEKKLEDAQSIAKVGHYTHFFKNNTFSCSKQIDDLLGIEEKDIKDINVWIKCIHPDDKDNVLNYWYKTMKSSSEYKIEYRLINSKTKESVWVLVLGEIIRDKNFNLLTMFGTIQNINERKIIEEKLSQAMMVFENTHDGIIITDKDANIINVNKSFESITGYTLHDVMGKKPSILKSEVNKDFFYTKIWKKLQENGVWSGEILNKKKDGSTYYEILTINAIYGANKEVNGYIGIFTDISQQKSDEKMLMTQSKVAAVGEMLGNIGHQWRQPLSVISTAATGLRFNLEYDSELDKDSISHTMDKINNQVQYLSKTIDDFRNFFKGDISDIKEISLKDAFIKLEKLTKDSLHNNYIKYDNKIEDISLILNENLFIQSLINIYNNAKDAMVDNRDYSEDRFLFIEAKTVDNNLEIYIRDTGKGISLDIIEKIFDPYFTTKHSSIGTGIGLYMTNQIITKQFHGQISANNIETTVNNRTLDGAEFKIILPLNK